MKSFEKEQICEAIFRAGGPYWHLYTPGNVTTAFLLNADDYAFAMNAIYFAYQLTAGIRILAFELMSNHLHILIEGEAEAVCRFFASLRKKLARGLASDRVSVLDSFVMQLKEIEDLRGLRNTIGYVHRNGYVVNGNHTPFSYPWGTNRYFYNDYPISETFKKIYTGRRRLMFRGRTPEISDSTKYLDGYVAPISYCSIDRGMSMFRDAHHYFSIVGKNVEAYSELALELNDGDCITDEEAFSQTIKICNTMYPGIRIRDLDKTRKAEIARKLHYEIHCSNGQIRRVLGLSQFEVDSLFPKTS